MNQQIQFIQFTPTELKELIFESVKTVIQEFSNQLKGTQPIKESKEFLTRKETAELFGVSLVCINDWQNNGILKRFKMGRRSYFKYSDLIETLYNSNRS